MRTQVAVVDYGSQYTQLIVRRVRELGYYARLYQLHQIGDITDPAGIILSGGPRSTKEKDAPDIDFAWLKGKARAANRRLKRPKQFIMIIITNISSPVNRVHPSSTRKPSPP